MRGNQHQCTAAPAQTARRILTAYTTLAFLALYLPVVVLFAFSFNDSPILTLPLSAPTLKWYRVLWADEDIHQSIRNSLLVALSVVPMTMLIGVPAAFTLDRFSFPGKAVLERVIMLPLMVQQLITGLAILLMIKNVGLSLSLAAVAVGHTVAWLPIVVTQVYARLRRYDRRLEEASMDLGANRTQTLIHVTLPNIRSALIGSALLVFTLSFDEIAIAFFLTGSENTLPTHIWGMLRRGVTPEINAIGAITITLSSVMILLQ